MFTAARQTSQGTQRCYAVCNIPEDSTNNFNNNYNYGINDFNIDTGNYTASTPRINRNFNTTNFFNSAIDNTIFTPLEHCVSDHADTPYSTPSARQIMSEISCGPIDDEEVFMESDVI
jgi:hypothetical protein